MSFEEYEVLFFHGHSWWKRAEWKSFCITIIEEGDLSFFFLSNGYNVISNGETNENHRMDGCMHCTGNGTDLWAMQ